MIGLALSELASGRVAKGREGPQTAHPQSCEDSRPFKVGNLCVESRFPIEPDREEPQTNFRN